MEVSSFVSNLAESHPMLVSVLAIWLLWAAASYMRKGSGVSFAPSGGQTLSKDEAMMAAREKQQKRVEAAAAARAPSPATATKSAATAVLQTACTPKAKVETKVESVGRRQGNDKETMTQRLARLERGKTSTSNPLQPATSSSSHVVR